MNLELDKKEKETLKHALEVYLSDLMEEIEPKSGIAPSDRLVADVMSRPPYAKARRVFWILEERLLGFQTYYEQIAQPLAWKFTRRDLDDLLHKINPPVAFPERLAA